MGRASIVRERPALLEVLQELSWYGKSPLCFFPPSWGCTLTFLLIDLDIQPSIRWMRWMSDFLIGVRELGGRDVDVDV